MHGNKQEVIDTDFSEASLAYVNRYYDFIFQKHINQFSLPENVLSCFDYGIFSAIQHMDSAPAGARKTADNFSKYKEYVKKCTDYTSVGGKMIRGILSFSMYLVMIAELDPQSYSIGQFYKQMKAFQEPSGPLETALTLCWANEILQGSLLTTDDIIDHGVERRGKKCWKDIVGNEQALMDGFFLMNLADTFISATIRDDTPAKYAKAFIGCWQHCKNLTLYGQHNDMHNFNKLWSDLGFEEEKGETPYEKVLDDIREQLKIIYISKTAYYTFVLPVSLAVAAAEMDSCRNINPDKAKILNELTVTMGVVFQLQDDFLDVYQPRLLKKPCTDIEEGKTTWCLWTALKCIGRAGNSNDQWKSFAADYAVPSKTTEQKQDIIKKMSVVGVQDEYQRVMHNAITKIGSLIDKLDEDIGYYCLNIMFDMLKKRCLFEE